MPSLSRKPSGQESEINTKAALNSDRSKLSYELIGLMGGLLIALIIAAAVGYYAYKILVLDVRTQQAVELTQQRAGLIADNIEAYLKKIHKGIEFYTRKSLLQEAIESQDQTSLNKYKEAIKKRVDDVVEVRFFRLGEAQLTDEFPPIRFSELDIIRRVEEREQVSAELANIDGKWLMTLVKPVPIKPEKDVVGIVVVTFIYDGIRELLQRSAEQYGKASLLQVFEGTTQQTVAEVGESNSEISQIADVPQSYWQIAFQPSQKLINQSLVARPIIYMGLGVAVVILLLIGGVLGKMIGRRSEYGRRYKNGGSAYDMRDVADVGGGVSDSLLYRTTDILDIEIAEGDTALLGLDDVEEQEENEEELTDVNETTDESLLQSVPDVIFRAYDIRGIAKDQVTNELARKVGQALGSEALDNSEDTLIVGRDARLHSPELTEWLIRGILSTGCNVLNIGTIPTPLLYFATETLDASQSGVVVTASHNDAEYNGFKIVIKGKCRSEHDIKAIRSRILRNDIYQGEGIEHRHDIIPSYIETIFSDVALAGDISVVIDAANGVTGVVAPRLFEELGCHVTTLFCELDGSFPNHPPDPTIASNLEPLIAKVQEVGADLGVAFDGDGDRLVVVTPKGKIIWPDRLLMLFAKDIVSRNPGSDVIFDVKSTRHLNQCVTNFGGRPIMWKTGHSPMKEKMMETGAMLGGEYSGHIYIKDRWFGFDDGLYAAARLIEILSLQGDDLDTLFEEFPESSSSPEVRIKVNEEDKFTIIEKLIATGDFGEAKVTTLDGLRADYKNGWGLVRASNTSATLTMRFEADDDETLHQLKAQFVRELRKVDNRITVEWD